MSSMSLDLRQLFPFDLDDFQKEAIAALDVNDSVVVCAPTGSGKTLIGEYAIYRALALNLRVFYTTPLKALSNQKFRDFGEQFGLDHVGLLTGDISINRDAPIVVMTTEIFRNMLYGTTISLEGTSLERVQTVVLDECHYMNDQQRGTVWEESIIYCPSEIQLVALSATVANSEQLTDWIAAVHGPTRLIYSDFRPVPLEFSFVNAKGMFPLLQTNSQGKLAANARLKTKKPQKLQRREERPAIPELSEVIQHLRDRDMLPAIYFIFSRRGCDQAVQMAGRLHLITDPEAEQRLCSQIEQFCRDYPEAIRHDHLDALYHGVAAHHAGMLPAWKGLIEGLFQQGLVKLVFATETLAAGINMPARTTVISSLSKRTDDGHRLLTASEFLQMSGRAGRRGKDVIGYVVTVQTPFEGAREAAFIATSKADPLVSQFTPSYGMVLNLLQKQSLERAEALIEKSFGQYLIGLQALPQQQELHILKRELSNLDRLLDGLTPETVQQFVKLTARRREERRVYKYLLAQAEGRTGEAAPELVAQNARIEAIQAQLEAHPLYGQIKPNQLERLHLQRERLVRDINRLERAFKPIAQQRWLEFLALAAVLTEFEYLQDYTPTATGEVAAAIRGDNELWLAMVLRSGELNTLTPAQFAGAIAAVVSETPRSGTAVRVRATPELDDVLYGLRGWRRALFKTQHHHDVLTPVWLEPRMAGVVEQWAAGLSWEAITGLTNLDEGDLVRLLRRTVDFISQIPHIPHLTPGLYRTAREALALLDRFPISEVI